MQRTGKTLIYRKAFVGCNFLNILRFFLRGRILRKDSTLNNYGVDKRLSVRQPTLMAAIQ